MDSVPTIQSMASSSSSSVPSSEGTKYFICQTKLEMESAKAHHWSQLDYPTTDSESSAETNYNYFALLKEDPQWARFFTDFPALEVGEKISGGSQADIYEARNTRDGPFDLVVKVMKGDAPLEAFRAQWPIGMLSARSKFKLLFDLPLITILGGTVLRDERLHGRFAFVMYRRWGDLRLLIDRRMKKERSTAGPFPMDEAIHLMLRIAKDMDTLHNKHDILHRDLKASNVLVWGGFGEDMSIVAPPGQAVARIGSVVADFECSVGVLGTRSWMAPEIFEQLKARVPCPQVQFTRASNVYSYGMTCYEIVTGCYPYAGLKAKDTISLILEGGRPQLSHDLHEFVRNIIVGCWHANPLERPSFSAICEAFKLEKSPNPTCVVIDNEPEKHASIVKVEKWNNPQALTLLEVMQKLMDMDLLVLKASDLSSTSMIMQYFEVTDCKGRKVEGDKIIANITKAIKFVDKMDYMSKSLQRAIHENTIPQIHVVEVVAECTTSLLGILSRLLVATKFQVHSAGCWTREGRVESVIFVEGARLSTLLWELQHGEECFPISIGRFKIVVHKVTAEEYSHLNSRLHNLKTLDLTRLCTSSPIRVHQRMRSREGCGSTEVSVIFLEGNYLLELSRKLADMGYKIVRASIEYPDVSQTPIAMMSQDIDFEYLCEDESEKIRRIQDLIHNLKCLKGNEQLILSGPTEKLHHHLMRSLRENDLIVTNGQVYCELGTGLSFSPKDLQFFVIEKQEARYRSILPFSSMHISYRD